MMAAGGQSTTCPCHACMQPPGLIDSTYLTLQLVDDSRTQAAPPPCMLWDVMHPLGIPAHNLHACMHCAVTDIVCMHARAKYNSIVLEVTVATEARCVSRSIDRPAVCGPSVPPTFRSPPHAIVIIMLAIALRTICTSTQPPTTQPAHRTLPVPETRAIASSRNDGGNQLRGR
jgi:hypothetical protein